MKKIMIVDDEAGMLALLGIVLKRKGFTVVTASDAPQALMMIPKEQPDLFILDVMMPGVSGFELCQTLKTRPDTAHVPVLLLSARFDMEAVQRGRAVGASEYLPKTTPPTHLINIVQALLQQPATGPSRLTFGGGKDWPGLQ